MINIPYGKTHLTVDLPQATVIAPKETAPAADVAGLVQAALTHPVGDARLPKAESVAIAISDKTRPIPHAAIYPLLAHLEALGINSDAVTLTIATGTHAPMTPNEFGKILPDDILARYRVVSHDCDADDLIHLGTTQRGTPVWANRIFAKAELRIVVGNLEPHQFMGFSGGVKSAAIGLAGRQTINTNHAMMRYPDSRLGCYDENPTRQDVEEIGKLFDIHFALNTILNSHKQIVDVLAGDPLEVMRVGVPMVRNIVEVMVEAPFDAVITSPGGHPKDINLYQAQKALAHAALITKDGGTVILVAACPEGTGSDKYEHWLDGMTSHQAVVERFNREEFRLGPHKAFQIARDALRVNVVLVSDMASDFVQKLLLTPAASLETSIANLPRNARIGIMPAANATVPVLR